MIREETWRSGDFVSWGPALIVDEGGILDPPFMRRTCSMEKPVVYRCRLLFKPPGNPARYLLRIQQSYHPAQCHA